MKKYLLIGLLAFIVGCSSTPKQPKVYTFDESLVSSPEKLSSVLNKDGFYQTNGTHWIFRAEAKK